MTSQLTYASADRIQGRPSGGWGIIAEVDVPPMTRALLEGGVVVDLPQTMPAFPTSAQLEQRPVRCIARTGQEQLLMWRAVEAGADSTSRPGNVFTHALAVPEAGAHHASAYFASDDWLMPFGPVEVADATLPAQFSPAELTDWEFVRHYVNANPALADVLPWITDLMTGALQKGFPVVICDSAHQRSLLWLAVAYATVDPQLARRLPCTTYVRGALIKDLLSTGSPHLIVATDMVGVESGTTTVILDPDWNVTGSGGQWLMPSGSCYPQAGLAPFVTRFLREGGDPPAWISLPLNTAVPTTEARQAVLPPADSRSAGVSLHKRGLKRAYRPDSRSRVEDDMYPTSAAVARAAQQLQSAGIELQVLTSTSVLAAIGAMESTDRHSALKVLAVDDQIQVSLPALADLLLDLERSEFDAASPSILLLWARSSGLMENSNWSEYRWWGWLTTYVEQADDAELRYFADYFEQLHSHSVDEPGSTLDQLDLDSLARMPMARDGSIWQLSAYARTGAHPRTLAQWLATSMSSARYSP